MRNHIRLWCHATLASDLQPLLVTKREARLPAGTTVGFLRECLTQQLRLKKAMPVPEVAEIPRGALLSRVGELFLLCVHGRSTEQHSSGVVTVLR